MKNIYLSKTIVFIVLPILSLYVGFFFDEDLSTGGSKLDFFHTLPAVIDYSNFIYDQSFLHTRHFPLHYMILSLPYIFYDDVFFIRIIYMTTSLLLPFLLYVNLNKIYKFQKLNCLIISFSLLLLPFVRSSAIWPNAHLTAVIFFLASNYYYLLNLEKSKFLYKFLNIFFLSLATYSIQSYAVLFFYYLFYYFKNISKKEMTFIIIICAFFSLPGIYLVLNIPEDRGLRFTKNISGTLITNLSIIFFFLSFFLFNRFNFSHLKKYLFQIKPIEILIAIIFFIFLIFTYEKVSNFGGGFFYKMSNFLLNNNILFFVTSFFGFVTCYIFFKFEKKLFFIILLINLTAIAYYTSQKYFEPLLLVAIFIMSENYLSKNIIQNFKSCMLFFLLIFLYFNTVLIYVNFNL